MMLQIFISARRPIRFKAATCSVPFVVAGGGALGVDTGRYLRLGGIEHNRLLVSLCHALGRSDVVRFGLMDSGTGPLSGFFA